MSPEEKIEPIPFPSSTLEATFLTPTILHVKFNRPKSLNSMNNQMFSEVNRLFTYLNTHPLLRVVILTANGRIFSAGLDLKEAMTMFQYEDNLDQARKSLVFYNKLKEFQESLSS